MTRDEFSLLGGKDERDVTPSWIRKAKKVVSKLNHELDQYDKFWDREDMKCIKRFFEKSPSDGVEGDPEEVHDEIGLVFGLFHSCMARYAGPLHCALLFNSELPVNEEATEKKYGNRFVYGGGFSSLDDEDIEFLNDNGYTVVAGPEGPECRLS